MKVKPIDANEILRKQGEDALRNAFDNAPRSMPTPHQAEAPARPRQKTKPTIITASVLRGTDYADMSAVSAKRWLVHHLLAIGEVSVPYGEPGSGKSVLAEDIGLHVAAGMDWHGRKVLRSAVLYVALERAAVVARRALAFGIEHGLVAAALPFKMIRGPLDFAIPRSPPRSWLRSPTSLRAISARQAS
jgi:AAA domain